MRVNVLAFSPATLFSQAFSSPDTSSNDSSLAIRAQRASQSALSALIASPAPTTDAAWLAAII
ncbi:hypothetical protein SOTOND1_00562 [Chlamydia trachomatis D/SotonD1]|nr:hypothetical protein SOTOND1_00562 [Chlamydia trachomatis D/SotonD1]